MAARVLRCSGECGQGKQRCLQVGRDSLLSSVGHMHTFPALQAFLLGLCYPESNATF